MTLVKREGASNLILTVLIWSVVSMLGTRTFLALAGNPTIGRGQWHIAHVLFGGIFMMGAMISTLIFEGKEIRKNMAAMFGVGWGLFIDETGKYLTRDNNYWFRPAIMIIYISFVLLFLVYKYLERRTKTKNKKGRLARALSRTFDKILATRLVMYGLWSYSIYYSVEKILDIIRISTSRQKMAMIQRFYQDYDFFGKSDVYMIVFKMVFDIVAAVFFLLGARYFWSRKRLRGIRFFRYGLYVSILLGSIFRFYFEQLGAITELIISVALLEILNEYRKDIAAK